MSEWRITLRELSSLGGIAESARFGNRAGRFRARQLGLMSCDGKGSTEWRMTYRGRQYLNGHGGFVRRWRGGLVWRAYEVRL